MTASISRFRSRVRWTPADFSAARLALVDRLNAAWPDPAVAPAVYTAAFASHLATVEGRLAAAEAAGDMPGWRAAAGEYERAVEHVARRAGRRVEDAARLGVRLAGVMAPGPASTAPGPATERPAR